MGLISRLSNYSRFAIGVIISATLLVVGCGGGGGGTSGNGGGKFIIGGDGDQWFSTNGASWTEMFGLVGSADTRGVAVGNGRFVFVGDTGVGSHGTAFSSSSLTDPNFNQIAFGGLSTAYDVAFGNGKFVAVGNDFSSGSIAWSSVDGVSWTPSTSPVGTNMFSVAYGKGFFVSDCGNGMVCRTSDGISWGQGWFPTAGDIRSISFGNETFLAMGWQPASNPVIWKSPNGLTLWSQPINIGDPGGTVTPAAAAYGNGRWIIVGAQNGVGHIWWSDDNGATWSMKLVGGTGLEDIAFANGQFVAVGSIGRIISSSDNGVTWSNVSLSGGGGLQTITYAP